MYTYTMTFTYDGDFDLPNDPFLRERMVPGMVLEKLERRDFELVDFNLSQNYDNTIIEHYIAKPGINRSVLEISLDLAKSDLKSREAIYNRCLTALKKNELCLNRAYENENEKKGRRKSIIVFNMKTTQATTA